MMERTDRHFRAFLRSITVHTLLYTEMVVGQALVHNPDTERFLGFDEVEHPLALQLGGDDPELLARCARMAEERGYDEVNLNVGCPSDRVQQGSFGACLMAEPQRVARVVEAMGRVVRIPVTVKHRIGIDHLDSYDDLLRFVDTVAAAGCHRFTVHARIAWLQGLSPKENREVPPLRYEDVYRLKAERPELDIEINGGIRTLDAVAEHLRHVDAVMIGRAAWDDPYLFAAADARFFGATGPGPSRRQVLEGYLPYVERQGRAGVRPSRLLFPTLGLFTGQRGARVYRRTLSEGAHRTDDAAGLLREAMGRVGDEVLDAVPVVDEGSPVGEPALVRGS
jgi:tRNA-dihydrouridine synthase A